MLFIDYSSAFNTIITKLRTLGLNTSLCNWILDFLITYPYQVVRVGNNTSTTLILITGAPQGACSASIVIPVLSSSARHDSNTIIKFADNISVVGLITNNDEAALS